MDVVQTEGEIEVKVETAVIKQVGMAAIMYTERLMAEVKEYI